MTRTERLAKLQRDLAQLKSRMQRIEHETHCGRQEIAEVEQQIKQLGAEEPSG